MTRQSEHLDTWWAAKQMWYLQSQSLHVRHPIPAMCTIAHRAYQQACTMVTVNKCFSQAWHHSSALDMMQSVALHHACCFVEQDTTPCLPGVYTAASSYT